MNSFIGVLIFQSQGVVLLVGKQADNSASTEWSPSLTQCHWQAAHLFAFRTQKNIPNQCDLNFCGRLPVLQKLQRIVLNGQCPGAVIPRVRESQQMSRPNAKWCAWVLSLSCVLRLRSQATANQHSREPQSMASVWVVSLAVTA